MIEIRELKITDQPAFMKYVDDWQADDSPFKIFSTEQHKDLMPSEFPVYLDQLNKQVTVAPAPNLSTATTFFAFVDGEIAGEINCRWEINKGNLSIWGGHIGYAVAPSFRRQGVATNLLTFALDKYQQANITPVMISAHQDNHASRQLIENVGGKLHKIAIVDGEAIYCYLIN